MIGHCGGCIGMSEHVNIMMIWYFRAKLVSNVVLYCMVSQHNQTRQNTPINPKCKKELGRVYWYRMTSKLCICEKAYATTTDIWRHFVLLNSYPVSRALRVDDRCILHYLCKILNFYNLPRPRRNRYQGAVRKRRLLTSLEVWSVYHSFTYKSFFSF